eukprot:CAMPEP_0184307208 /NCGR_PEP_ID=MMETSP1049-20130417/16019_1 /TAXON_ID=77928 /ORGANISM="Proteomonas sulcata, Strain CCMP704" /LENGTH=389 /DNA_ID=CAMNT_0026619653 /DNA_START=143 /DNA_END=1312 /DNA_ORIENTATION=+
MAALNTIVTFASILFIYRFYWHKQLLLQVSKHLDYGARMDTFVPAKVIMAKVHFWAEVLFSFPFLPPFVTFEIGFLQLDNFVLYRAETAMCIINSLRLYHLVRLMKDHSLSDLPNKSTVRRFTNQKLQYVFSAKRVFNSYNSMAYITLIWMIMLLVHAYWFRAAEFSACRLASANHADCKSPAAEQWTLYGSPIDQTAMIYFQNAAWAMWITSTTVGYGDIFPITHCGRFVAASAAISGAVIAAFVTASLGNILQRTPNEEAAVGILRKFQAREQLLIEAVNLVSLWWRKKRRPGNLSRRQRAMVVNGQAQTLRKIHQEARKDLKSIKSLSGHLTDTLAEGKEIIKVVDELFDMIHQPPPEEPAPIEEAKPEKQVFVEELDALLQEVGG